MVGVRLWSGTGRWFSPVCKAKRMSPFGDSIPSFATIIVIREFLARVDPEALSEDHNALAKDIISELQITDYFTGI